MSCKMTANMKCFIKNLILLIVIIFEVLAIEEQDRFKRVFKGEGGEFQAVVLKGARTCTGSLINDQWILTAAHCLARDTSNGLQFERANRLKARLGDPDRHATIWEWIKHYAGKVFRKPDWLIYEVKAQKVIVHPKYHGRATSWRHDIVLVKLKKTVPAGVERVLRIQAVTLPLLVWGRTWSRDQQQCVIKGWGCIMEGGEVENYLWRAHVPKTADSICRRIYYYVNTELQMCAGEEHLGKGTCNGDSGGPLVCKY